MRVIATKVFVDMDGILRKKGDSFQIADDKAVILIDTECAVKGEIEPIENKPKARQTRTTKPKTRD